MPISLSGGIASVVLGVGDLRITTLADERGFQYMTISQGDVPRELGAKLLDKPELREWMRFPAKILLSSVNKEGIDNLIAILQGMSEAWGKPPQGTPLSELEDSEDCEEDNNP